MATYKHIAQELLTSSASTISFTSIPQTYTDLLLKISTRNGNGLSQFLTFNSTSTGYAGKLIQGTGTSANAQTTATTYLTMLCADNRSTGNTFGNAEVYITNYTSSNTKAVRIDSVTETNDNNFAYRELLAGSWANSAAITTITLTPEVGTFASGSLVNLYGIKNS